MFVYLIYSLLVATALGGSYGNDYSSNSRRFSAPASRDSLLEASPLLPVRVRAAPIPIKRHSMRNDHRGNYELDFESGDGTQHSSKSVLKKVGDSEVAVQSGTISWRSPEGVLYTLNYIADETGFHPVGDHLPTPPPIPEEHRRALPTLEEQRKQEDNYYGYETPGYSSYYGSATATQPPPSRPVYTSDYSDNYNQKPEENLPPPPPPMPQTTFRPLPMPVQQTTFRPLPVLTQTTFRPLPEPEPTFQAMPDPETTFRPLPMPETTFRPLPMPDTTFRPMVSITGRPPRPRPTTESPLFQGSLPVNSINLSQPSNRPILSGANVIHAPDVPILIGPSGANFRTFVNTTHVLIDSDNSRTILRIRQPPMQKL